MTAPAVLIAGASSGVGWACALDRTRRGRCIFATIRKQPDAILRRAPGHQALTGMHPY